MLCPLIRGCDAFAQRPSNYYLTDQLMNKNDTAKLVIFAAALRLSLDACSVKALIP